MAESSHEARTGERRRYIWPWFVLAAVVLAVVLAVLWLSVAIERTRRQREWNNPAPQTNSVGNPVPAH
jgi:hypothetical protein